MRANGKGDLTVGLKTRTHEHTHMPTVEWRKATGPANPETQPSTATPAPEDPTQPTAAVATTVPSGPVVVAEGADNDGEFDPKDRSYPYLSLFSANSKGSTETPAWIGSWVLDKAHTFGKEIVIIPVHLKKMYEEVTEFGSGDIPDRWSTMQEAKDSGKQYQEYAEIRCLIEVPEAATKADESLAARAIALGGRKYAAAVYTVRRSSYKVYRTIRTDYDGWLKRRYVNGMYRLGIGKAEGPKGAYLVPTIRSMGNTPDDVREAIRTNLGY